MRDSETENSCQDELLERVRAAAFRLLLDTGVAVDVTALNTALDIDPVSLAAAVDELDRRGLIRRDGNGQLVGSYGLSIVPSQDTIEFDGRRFWTWCAKTSLGVLAAIDRGGLIVATSPDSGSELRVSFEGSRPRAADGVVVFWPSDDMRATCGSVVDELCPNYSFFGSAAAAEAWARANGVSGDVLSLDDATDRAVDRWRPLVGGARQ